MSSVPTRGPAISGDRPDFVQSPDAEILGAFEELVHHKLLVLEPILEDNLASYRIHSVKESKNIQ
jgi:hypothetical protein